MSRCLEIERHSMHVTTPVTSSAHSGEVASSKETQTLLEHSVPLLYRVHMFRSTNGHCDNP